MDDDLKTLGTALAEPGPSPETVERSRARLHATMRGAAMRGAPVRGRRRVGWPAGLGLIAVAAAAAIVIAATVPGADPGGPGGAGAERPPSGRQVLLMAATVAESRPATSGTYWLITRESHAPSPGEPSIGKVWTRRDGQVWVSSRPGMISKLGKREPIELNGTRLGLDEIQRLPAEPAALRAALLGSRSGHREIDEELEVFGLLMSLLYEVPAPPPVRAAAFRALADLPHLENRGKVRGGYSLVLTIDEGGQAAGTKAVVDPATTTVRTEGFTVFGGKEESMGATTMTGEWTDELTGRLVPLAEQAPKRKRVDLPPVPGVE